MIETPSQCYGELSRMIRSTDRYKIWRKEVMDRAGWQCEGCGEREKLTAHHPRSFSLLLYENDIQDIVQALECEEIWEAEGMALCRGCHDKAEVGARTVRYNVYDTRDKVLEVLDSMSRHI